MQNKNFLIENGKIKNQKNFINIFETEEYNFIKQTGYNMMVKAAKKQPKQRTPEFEKIVQMMKYNYEQATLPKTQTKKFINIEKTKEFNAIKQYGYKMLVEAA